MSEDELRKDVSRAVRMKEWAAGDEGLFSIFDAVERAYLATIADSKLTDTAGREQLYHRVSALRDVRKVMQDTISKGMSATKLIEAMTAKAEKKQRKAPNVA